jgi:hypothetical protein
MRMFIIYTLLKYDYVNEVKKDEITGEVVLILETRMHARILIGISERKIPLV